MKALLIVIRLVGGLANPKHTKTLYALHKRGHHWPCSFATLLTSVMILVGIYCQGTPDLVAILYVKSSE